MIDFSAAAVYGIDITAVAREHESRTGTAVTIHHNLWDWMVEHSVAVSRNECAAGPVTILYRTDNAVSVYGGTTSAVRPFDAAVSEDATEVLWEAFELLGLNDIAPAGDPQWLLVLSAQERASL